MQNLYFSQIMGTTRHVAAVVVPVLLVLYSEEIVTVFNTILDYAGINPAAHAARIEAAAALADQAHEERADSLQIAVAREASVVELVQENASEVIETFTLTAQEAANAIALKDTQIEERGTTIRDLEEHNVDMTNSIEEILANNQDIARAIQKLRDQIVDRKAIHETADLITKTDIQGLQASLKGSGEREGLFQATRRDAAVEYDRRVEEIKVMTQGIVRETRLRNQAWVIEAKQQLRETVTELAAFKEEAANQTNLASSLKAAEIGELTENLKRAAKAAFEEKNTEFEALRNKYTARQRKYTAWAMQMEQNLTQEIHDQQAHNLSERVQEKSRINREHASAIRNLTSQHDSRISRVTVLVNGMQDDILEKANRLRLEQTENIRLVSAHAEHILQTQTRLDYLDRMSRDKDAELAAVKQEVARLTALHNPVSARGPALDHAGFNSDGANRVVNNAVAVSTVALGVGVAVAGGIYVLKVAAKVASRIPQ